MHLMGDSNIDTQSKNLGRWIFRVKDHQIVPAKSSEYVIVKELRSSTYGEIAP